MRTKTMDNTILGEKKKKVAILGTVPHKMQAPFNDFGFEIWAIAHACLGEPLPRVDRIFEIHKWDEVVKWGSPGAWAMHPAAPVYLQEARADVPNSLAFPFDEMIKKFQIFDDRNEANMTNSISWMIALAIHEEFEEIHIYGVNMSHHTEYCIDGETEILTNDLVYKKAKDILVGEEIIAFDENHVDEKNERKFRKAVVQKADVIERPCYKLTFEDGTQIICSAEHRWLVGGGDKIKWVETENMRAKGDYIDDRCTHVLKPFDKWRTETSYEAGYLAAAVDGEGHLCQRGKKNPAGGYNSCSIGFSQKENGMLSKFYDFSEQLGFNFNGKTDITGCHKTQLTTRKDVVRFLGSIRPERLLEKFDIELLGRLTGKKVALIKKERLGKRKVIAFKTTTGTFIAEGFASHNSTQKPSCEYYLGLAKGMGKKIYVPKESDLMKSYFQYGREEEKQTEIINKIQEHMDWLTNQYNQQMQQIEQLRDSRNQHIGAIENCKHFLGIFKH